MFDFASNAEIVESWKYLDESAVPPTSALEAHVAVENGLPASMLRNFREAVDGLSIETWANIMAISESQFKRLNQKNVKRLPRAVGSQMVMFALLLRRAEDLFGSKEAALTWLNEEQMALSGRKPVDLLDTFIGQSLVERTLTQIDYGVYV